MTEITVTPATAALLDDVEEVFAGGGDGPGCQCQWPVLPAAEWRACSRAERRARFEAELAGDLPPGLLAVVDDEPAGWVRIGPRINHTRLLGSRIVKTGAQQPLDAPDVWVISCLSVRTSQRRRGVTSTLIDAAVTFAYEHGARSIEAYPIDTSASTVTSNDLFVGSVSQFERAGFTLTAHPTPRRAVMTHPGTVR